MTALLDNPHVFAAYEHSGRWDRDLALVAKSADRIQRTRIGPPRRRVPVSVGMHTEMDRDQLEAAFRHQPDNWSHARLDATDAAQMIGTFDRDVWQRRTARAIVLSDLVLYTAKDFQLPQPTMLEVVLEHNETGVLLYLEGLHWPLQNTANRRRACRDVEDNLQSHWHSIVNHDPDAAILHLADTNRDIRTSERNHLVRVAAGVPGFHQSWDLRHLPDDGTHDHALIDNGLTNLPLMFGGAQLLADDPSSDHRPWACGYRLPAAPKPARARSVAPTSLDSWVLTA